MRSRLILVAAFAVLTTIALTTTPIQGVTSCSLNCHPISSARSGTGLAVPKNLSTLLALPGEPSNTSSPSSTPLKPLSSQQMILTTQHTVQVAVTDAKLLKEAQIAMRYSTPVSPPPVTVPVVSSSVPVAESVPTSAPIPAVSSGSGGWTYAAAEKVAWCEERGFEGAPATGPSYYGWLGISGSNWSSTCPDLDRYSVSGNIACASRIQSTPPDQGGCGGGW